MKYIGPAIAVGLTTILVLLIVVFSFVPVKQSSVANDDPNEGQPIVVEQAAPQPLGDPQLDALAREREAVYQAQLENLNQTWQSRQAAYQTQIDQVTAQLATLQEQLATLQAQEASLKQQISELEATRNDRLQTYESQLQQAQSQYQARYETLQAQLRQVEAKLAEAQN